VEKKNIYECGGVTGARSIIDKLAERNVKHRVYTYHHWKDAEILAQARRDIAGSDAEFFLLYLSEVDMFLHSHCKNPASIGEKIAWYDSQLRQVLAEARKVDPEASLVVFSDHGMTPVDQYYDLMKEIESLPVQMPRDYLAIYDSTMARFWFFSEGARRKIIERLKSSRCGRIVPDAELRDLGVFFADGRYGELVFLLDPGWMLARSDFNGPRWIPAGMHGYHPDDRHSDAIFLASREPSGEVRTIADVYQCMHAAAFPQC
jgi:predicted AlkP superfamily pyrophosphatase or phosphodiesterase